MQTEPPKAEQPKRKRRWFQFSLRSLFVVTTIVAVAVWIICDVRPASIPLALLVLLWACVLVAIVELLARSPPGQ
ncbi:MAG TPA: hypothetical protein VGY55_13520 [Pirellulales bacterium]|nr:hypothetical protein [Pirellulales bacterium]